MENNFQQEIISEISKYQRMQEYAEINSITRFTDFTENECKFKDIQTPFGIYEVPLPEFGDTNLLKADQTPIEISDIKYLVVQSIETIDDLELRIDQLRQEYELIFNAVCPV